MSIVPATDIDCPIFNADDFTGTDGASGNYVAYPNAQGNTVVLTQTVNGTLKLSSAGIEPSIAGAVVNVQNATGTINIGTTATAASTVNIGNSFKTVSIGDLIDLKKVSISSSRGVAGEALLSGGPSGNVTWGTIVSYKTGFVDAPSASTRTLVTFGYTFTSTATPYVYLTYDGGSSATTIVVVGVAGFQGSANAWTGFYYLTSSAGGAGTKMYWLATN